MTAKKINYKFEYENQARLNDFLFDALYVHTCLIAEIKYSHPKLAQEIETLKANLWQRIK